MPVFIPGEFHGQRSLAGTGHGVAELDTTEWLTLRALGGFTHCQSTSVSLLIQSSSSFSVGKSPNWPTPYFSCMLYMSPSYENHAHLVNASDSKRCQSLFSSIRICTWDWHFLQINTHCIPLAPFICTPFTPFVYNPQNTVSSPTSLSISTSIRRMFYAFLWSLKPCE